MMQTNETERRGNCFKLLAACFYEPDKTLFLEERLCNNLKDLLEGWSPGAAKAAADMELVLRAADQEQLSVDYSALFIGPFELLAAPYGSVYLEKQRQLMGDSTMAVLKKYQGEGLDVDVKEPPDHIAIELEFMHHLCTREALATVSGNEKEAERYRELQKDFQRSSLHWVPSFCSAIRQGTDNRFYVSLADCLDQFIVTCNQFYEATPITQ